MNKMHNTAWLLTFIGFILGASLGYFYRPPALFIGQLPFDVVITRGGHLRGFDQLYLEVAKTSFNYLAIGGISGAILGAVAGMTLTKNVSKKGR